MASSSTSASIHLVDLGDGLGRDRLLDQVGLELDLGHVGDGIGHDGPFDQVGLELDLGSLGQRIRQDGLLDGLRLRRVLSGPWLVPRSRPRWPSSMASLTMAFFERLGFELDLGHVGQGIGRDGVLEHLGFDLHLVDLGDGLGRDRLLDQVGLELDLGDVGDGIGHDGPFDDIRPSRVLLGDLLADLGEGGGERVVDAALRLLDGLGAVVSSTLRARGRRSRAGRAGASSACLRLRPRRWPLGVERDDLEIQRLAFVNDVARMGDALVR